MLHPRPYSHKLLEISEGRESVRLRLQATWRVLATLQCRVRPSLWSEATRWQISRRLLGMAAATVPRKCERSGPPAVVAAGDMPRVGWPQESLIRLCIAGVAGR